MVLGEAPADLVLCSHAHFEHARGLWALHQQFPHLPIYASETTARLLPLNWPGDEAPTFGRGLPWRLPINLAADLKVELWPAGHLPGAACMLLSYTAPERSYRVFYTGDCLLSHTRLVEGLPLEELRGLKPDVLIIEGAYGTGRYSHRRQQENQLAERLRQVLERTVAAGAPHSIALPAPILGLGQELLMLLRSHHHFSGYPVTLWVDSWVGAGCDAYLQQLSAFPRNVQNFAQHQPLFWDERIFPQVKPLAAAPKTLPVPSIVIVHPATPPDQYCRRHAGEWTVFLPELTAVQTWQSQVSPVAYDWLDAFKNATASGTVSLETYPLVSHCDGAGTTQLIHNLRPRYILLVHGSPDRLADLANLEDLQARYQIRIPLAGQSIELPIESRFWQPPPPSETVYAGEVTETAQAVTLTLPSAITEDPSWAQFADTGLMEARWQGNQLMLRGLSQSELLRSAPAKAAQRPSCFSCRYRHHQHCRNPKSPLFNRLVTPDGYCPEFAGGSGI